VFCHHHGIKYAILRYPRVVGATSNTVVNKIISSARSRETVKIVDGGAYRFDLVHIHDVVQANIRLLDHFEAEGIFHVSGRESLSIVDICDIVEKCMGIEIVRRCEEARGLSDGAFLPNPLFMACSRITHELGYHIRMTSTAAIQEICEEVRVTC